MKARIHPGSKFLCRKYFGIRPKISQLDIPPEINYIILPHFELRCPQLKTQQSAFLNSFHFYQALQIMLLILINQ